MIYEIFEGNMDRLEKKLLRIYNKCKAYGCSFHYARVGESFRELQDDQGKSYTARFIQVEAEGTAVMNDWEFVASVEHTDNGNIFSGVKDIEVPKRYYTGSPICEHCNTNRYRKYTYIVRNTKTGEFKQVGKSCLNDFTHGLSAEHITQYISLFDALIEGQTPEPCYHGEHYLARDKYLAYVAETVRCFGYVKAGSDEQSTASRALDYYLAARGDAISGHYLKHLLNEMERYSFNVEGASTIKLVQDAVVWISVQEEDNNYIHNLKTVCGLEYTTYKNIGLLASLIPVYRRAMERNERQRGYMGRSEHVGKTGDRISVEIQSVKCLCSYKTQYGTSHMYKFVGTNGNIFIWKTTTVVEECQEPLLLTGIVKEHMEYKATKQTLLTRCQITKSLTSSNS